MALVHDMAECIVGDLTPADAVDKEEKHRREEVDWLVADNWNVAVRWWLSGSATSCKMKTSKHEYA